MTTAQIAHLQSRDVCAQLRSARRLTAVTAYEAYRHLGFSQSLALSFAAEQACCRRGSIPRWVRLVRGVSPADQQQRLFLLLDRHAKGCSA
ncbi:MAG: hypothetical protein ABIV36_01145 [Sphingobium limneticum]